MATVMHWVIAAFRGLRMSRIITGKSRQFKFICILHINWRTRDSMGHGMSLLCLQCTEYIVQLFDYMLDVVEDPICMQA
jgi:hypothetical protein